MKLQEIFDVLQNLALHLGVQVDLVQPTETPQNYIEVGGLRWSPELLTGASGVVNPDNGISYFTSENTETEATKHGLLVPRGHQYEQLWLRTTQKPTEQDGQPGILFTDKENDNTLFFPAAGYCHGPNDQFHCVGRVGEYWGFSSFYKCTCFTIYKELNTVMWANPLPGLRPVRCIIKDQNSHLAKLSNSSYKDQTPFERLHTRMCDLVFVTMHDKEFPTHNFLSLEDYINDQGNPLNAAGLSLWCEIAHLVLNDLNRAYRCWPSRSISIETKMEYLLRMMWTKSDVYNKIMEAIKSNGFLDHMTVYRYNSRFDNTIHNEITHTT